VVDTAVTG
jgi:hypothetical protein